MKFRKKPIVIEAHQWFKNGDHPLDKVGESDVDASGYPYEVIEGKLVRFYRNPEISGHLLHCEVPETQNHECMAAMDRHGWIDTLEGGHTVCPGDWIITGISGEFYPCKPDIFHKTYEPVNHSDDGFNDGRNATDVEFYDNRKDV